MESGCFSFSFCDLIFCVICFGWVEWGSYLVKKLEFQQQASSWKITNTQWQHNQTNTQKFTKNHKIKRKESKKEIWDILLLLGQRVWLLLICVWALTRCIVVGSQDQQLFEQQGWWNCSCDEQDLANIWDWLSQLVVWWCKQYCDNNQTTTTPRKQQWCQLTWHGQHSKKRDERVSESNPPSTTDLQNQPSNPWGWTTTRNTALKTPTEDTQVPLHNSAKCVVHIASDMNRIKRQRGSWAVHRSSQSEWVILWMMWRALRAASSTKSRVSFSATLLWSSEGKAASKRSAALLMAWFVWRLVFWSISNQTTHKFLHKWIPSNKHQNFRAQTFVPKRFSLFFFTSLFPVFWFLLAWVTVWTSLNPFGVSICWTRERFYVCVVFCFLSSLSPSRASLRKFKHSGELLVRKDWKNDLFQPWIAFSSGKSHQVVVIGAFFCGAVGCSLDPLFFGSHFGTKSPPFHVVLQPFESNLTVEPKQLSTFHASRAQKTQWKKQSYFSVVMLMRSFGVLAFGTIDVTSLTKRVDDRWLATPHKVTSPSTALIFAITIIALLLIVFLSVDVGNSWAQDPYSISVSISLLCHSIQNLKTTAFEIIGWRIAVSVFAVTCLFLGDPTVSAQILWFCDLTWLKQELYWMHFKQHKSLCSTQIFRLCVKAIRESPSVFTKQNSVFFVSFSSSQTWQIPESCGICSGDVLALLLSNAARAFYSISHLARRLGFWWDAPFTGFPFFVIPQNCVFFHFTLICSLINCDQRQMCMDVTQARCFLSVIGTTSAVASVMFFQTRWENNTTLPSFKAIFFLLFSLFVKEKETKCNFLHSWPSMLSWQVVIELIPLWTSWLMVGVSHGFTTVDRSFHFTPKAKVKTPFECSIVYQHNKQWPTDCSNFDFDGFIPHLCDACCNNQPPIKTLQHCWDNSNICFVCESSNSFHNRRHSTL